MVQNKGLIFKKVPTGWPKAGEHLTIEDRPIDLESTPPPENGLLTENFYVSFDPYQRGRMRPAEVKSYAPPYELGKPISNGAVCKVLKSGTSKFKEGDIIFVNVACPTEEYSLLPAGIVERAVSKIENKYGIDLKTFVGALGMPGLTAYSSFYEIGQPKKGDIIFISAASGAVGQLVGQLAKREGLKVIGSVGDDKKLEFLVNELGFDGGFNYKKEKPADALKRLVPDGITIYYENVGGEHLEAALDALQNHGRIVACGMVSQYNLPDPEKYPLRNIMQVVAKRITMRGFIVGDPDIGPKYAKEHQENVQKWIADGSIKAEMSITKGIDYAAEGLIGMLEGKNFGKAVLVIKEMD
jgi:NADPH-dependent curcumin reductase CurA